METIWPLPIEFEHGAALENKLEQEVRELCATYKGVIIRLHVLGDFYSVQYVRLA